MNVKPFYSNNVFSRFTKKYSLSKTLRFELVPEFETNKYLNQFIVADTQRDKDYKGLKKIIDDYHKNYIERSLSDVNILKKKDLEKIDELLSETRKLKLYKKKLEKEKELDEFQKRLRVQIVKCFKDKQGLFDKKLITELLPKWLDENKKSLGNAEYEKKKKIISQFSGFTTYLTGFHENRKNIYSDKEQSTAISYRVINENLSRFLLNKEAYRKISTNFPELRKKLEDIKSELKEEFDYFKINSVKEFFKISFFNKCLTQKEIDNYNFIVGGRTLENGKKIKGINEEINLYRQKKRTDKQIKISNKNLPLIQILHKQILSDRQSHSFYFPEEFKDRKEVLESIREFWKKVFKTKYGQGLNVLQGIEYLLTENLSDNSNELDKIYFKRSELSQFSNKLFEDYNLVQSALYYYSGKEFSNKREREQWLKEDFFSFNEIHKALSVYSKEENQDIELPKGNSLLPFNFESALFFYFKFEIQDKKYKIHNSKDSLNLLSYIKSLYKIVQQIPDSSQDEFNKKEIESIQSFLKSLMDLLHLIKPVYLEKDKMDKDTVFYDKFEDLYKELLPVIKLYNKSRNYIARNKNSLEKIKINFEDSTLLDGWDVNKEKDNLSVILRKKKNGQWLYYLGVMNKKNNTIFDYQLNFGDYNRESSIKRKSELRGKIVS